MKIVIIATRLPYPEISGGIKRIISICKLLRVRGNTITLLTFVNSKDDEKHIAEGRLDYLFDDIYSVRLGVFEKICNLTLAIFSRKPFQVFLFRSNKMRRLIEKINRNSCQDLSICHMIRACEYQDQIRSDRKIMELTDSLSLNFSRKVENLGAYSPFNFIKKFIYSIEARRLRDAEIECLDINEKAVLVSDVDREFILSGCKGDNFYNKLVTIPLGIPDEVFIDPARSYDANTIAFVGKMDYEPNENAVLYFVRHILPTVKLSLPYVRFKIVGSSPSDRIQKLASDDTSITVTGRVECIADHMADSALSVALMQSGAGMQTKILESIAMGVPVVTNRLGFEGIDLVPNAEIMVAANNNEAATMIIQLLSDAMFRQRLSVSGHKALFTTYSSSQVLSDYIS